MSFLDRFKLQPKWKHTDPAVRAVAVAEIPDDDEHRGVIEEIALSDEDVRVRRAAASYIEDVPTLVRMARSEPDADLRREIVDRLVGVAVTPAPNDADAALALEGLDDPKHFSTIAKSSPHDNVRAAALGRVTDARALGSIARHATDPQTALDAVVRVSDPAELLNIALKTDHKDAGITALEKTVEAAADARETLDTIANRARNKSIAKRARAMVQAMDDAAASKRQALEQWQHRVGSVMARVEAIAAFPSVPDAARQLADAEAEWRSVTGDGSFELDADTAGRFGALVDAARAAIAAEERADAERRAAAEHAAAVRAAQLSICERLENARADDALDAIEKARGEWEGLPGPSAQETEHNQMLARFEEACRRAAERHQNQQHAQQTNTRLEELAAEAERLAPEEQYSDEAWQAVTR
jgi:hypothetical protein